MALVLAIFVPMMAFGLTRSTNAGSDLPQNKLTCTTLGPGKLVDIHAGKPAAPVAIQFAKICTWEWPSEWTACCGSRTFQNPMTTVKLADGTIKLLPGNDEVVFYQNSAKVN